MPPKFTPTTKLEKAVYKWSRNHYGSKKAEIKDSLEDLLHGGCQSGIVSSLIYYVDTLAFYKKHQAEINQLLQELIDGTGLGPNDLFKDWDDMDPLALDTQNQNLLAWFGFEETGRKIYETIFGEW